MCYPATDIISLLSLSSSIVSGSSFNYSTVELGCTGPRLQVGASNPPHQVWPRTEDGRERSHGISPFLVAPASSYQPATVKGEGYPLPLFPSRNDPLPLHSQADQFSPFVSGTR